MARINIDDLSVNQDLDREEVKGIFGGSSTHTNEIELQSFSWGETNQLDTSNVSLNYEKCTPTYTKRKKDGGSD